MTKRMDEKLARIRAGGYTPKDFIIADAKDADMAFGCQTPGMGADGRYRPLKDYRDDMVKVIASDRADIMLTSLSSAEALQASGAFSGSHVTPAVRLNDTTDIWRARGSVYGRSPAQPFRSARLDRVKAVADLGLYAITFYNDLEQDRMTLDNYARFRDEASAAGVRHFLEVFNPQFDVVTGEQPFWAYNNDSIARCLAGVSRHERPVFLKAVYNGPRATEEIAAYDPGNLIFGVLGGGAGTTRDCLELIAQAEKYGARVALFGRKLYYAEDSVLMLAAMRRVLEERISSAEGVKAYHADLAKAKLKAQRALDADLELTEALLKQHAA
jgi:DhnA family fructose-bisphosphate aldolase class Ia